MKKIKSRTVLIFIFLACIIPQQSLAQQSPEVQALIRALLAQVAVLQEQLRVLQLQQGITPSCSIIRTLSKGARGEDVTCLQNFLISRGHLEIGNNTGYFGSLTEAAVQKYQATQAIVSSGTPATTGYGAVGPRTRAAMAAAGGLPGQGGGSSSTSPVDPITPTLPTASGVVITQTLSLGSRGEEVTRLQQFLVSRGHLAPDSATGYFGVLTQTAVQQYQSAQGIVSSGSPATTGYGVVGGRTRAAIAAASNTGVSISPATPLTPSFPIITTPPLISGGGGGGGGDGGGGTPPPASCTFNGISVAHASSTTAFQAVSVPSGSQCVSQLRTCTNGTLSGTYTFSSCTPGAAQSCTLDGVAVAHGASHPFYSTTSVPFGSKCTSVSQSRTCNNGTLSGSATFSKANCTVTPGVSCTLDGIVVPHGQNAVFYSTQSVPAGSSCSTVDQRRTCTNGTLSGDNTYNKATCSVASLPFSTTTFKNVAGETVASIFVVNNPVGRSPGEYVQISSRQKPVYAPRDSAYLCYDTTIQPHTLLGPNESWLVGGAVKFFRGPEGNGYSAVRGREGHTGYTLAATQRAQVFNGVPNTRVYKDSAIGITSGSNQAFQFIFMDQQVDISRNNLLLINSGSFVLYRFSDTFQKIDNLIIDSDGDVGIGPGTHKDTHAKLDIRGPLRLKQYAAAPTTCNATQQGSLALTSRGTMCSCMNSQWKKVNSTALCVW